jgi:hypothetical protein
MFAVAALMRPAATTATRDIERQLDDIVFDPLDFRCSYRPELIFGAVRHPV